MNIKLISVARKVAVQASIRTATGLRLYQKPEVLHLVIILLKYRPGSASRGSGIFFWHAIILRDRSVKDVISPTKYSQ